MDAHKYLFGKRAVIYGEEDMVVALTSFLAEVGITPVLCASGGRSGRFKQAIERVTAGIAPASPSGAKLPLEPSARLAERRNLDRRSRFPSPDGPGSQAPPPKAAGNLASGPTAIREGMDFQQIEELALELSPDLLIGHSKGYTLARKLGIPLIRVGFPIHDRFGAQRILHVGYRGTQSLLDRIVNALIEEKSKRFAGWLCIHVRKETEMNISRDLSRHPCFNAAVKGSYGRVHLPVAPHCNIRCNYCNRKYDCVNESRPGVTSALLSPAQASLYMEKILEREPRISVAGIAGPGDPFANPEETLGTLRLIREKFPHILLCLSTNGLANRRLPRRDRRNRGLPCHYNGQCRRSANRAEDI